LIGMNQRAGRGAWIKFVIVIAFMAALFIAFRLLPLEAYLGTLFDFIRRLGIWGPVLYAAIYVVATVLMFPGSLLTLGAGFLFGLGTGLITVSIGSLAGATCAFLLGRTLARGFVEQQAARHPRFAALDRAVEREGFLVVLLTRLSPLFPFNLLNYLFSITKVRLRDYVLASGLGMIPGALLYVYLGTAAKDLAQLLAGDWSDAQQGVWPKVVLGLGLMATVAATLLITRIASSALRKYVPEKTSPD
jgi:uncharacterized membrane protein YdjX (TVP38/TMEM64 family)